MENATCFFENENGVCRVIAVDKCSMHRKSICSFQKSWEEVTEGRRKALERLGKLSLDLQTYIADKYYGGKRPWEKEAEA